MDNGMHHHRGHWSCCIMPILSWIFWAAAIIFTIASWVSVTKDITVWNYGAQWWIVNALIFGLLALFGRGRCHCAGCVGGMYKVEK
jgi:hypothetical protein